MPLSSIDFLSPKITFFYKGRDSHISQIGGLLSSIFLALLILFIINFCVQIINPQISSLLIYEQTMSDYKYNISIDYAGISHFIQMYGDSSSGWFEDFNNKNIIIYGIKENINIYDNDNENEIDLYKTEHWVYDKCKNIPDINKNLFENISKIIKDYTKTICIRFYYDPYQQKYYQVGFEGYVPPNLETNLLTEKKYFYKIIVEKCFNNSIFNDKFHFVCNSENEIKKYINLYDDIILYFSNNQILPKNKNNPFEKYFFSVSSGIQTKTCFEKNIIFSPISLRSENNIFRSKKEFLSYSLKNIYQNDKYIGKELKAIGAFNFYFINNLIIYQRKYFSILDALSHLGGFSHLLFFIFQLFNYVISRYTIIENTKDLFKINTGIDPNNYEVHEITFDKMRHQTSQNYKIKVFNNNNIINNEDLNISYLKNQGKKQKNKYSNYEYHGYGMGNKSSKKNLGVFPVNTLHGKKNNFDTKRTQTKYTCTFKQMGKQLTLKNKRKSFLSQGYLIKRKDYSNLAKIQSANDNEANNDLTNNNNNNNINSNNIVNDNNNSSFLLLKESKDKELKEGFLKHDSKNIEDSNNSRWGKKKTNLRKNLGISPFDGIQVPQINIKRIDNNFNNIKGRHKSVNFGNQQGNFLFSANLLGVKNMSFAKNPSENMNDSSKQISNQNQNQNKNPFQVHNSKFQNDKNKYDDIISRPSISNKNDTHLNTVIYNGNTETASYLKTIIQSKIKLIMPEIKQNYNLINFLESKMRYFEFFKYIIICKKRSDHNITLITKFRKKLLSEEHLFKVHINLYLLEKIFQIDEQYKFGVNELYNNL